MLTRYPDMIGKGYGQETDRYSQGLEGTVKSWGGYGQVRFFCFFVFLFV